MLEFRQVSKTFTSGYFIKEQTRAVCNASFRIDTGMTVGLAGNSGCGKSTIARMLLAAIPPDKGEILYQGQSVAKMTIDQRKDYRRQVQIIFQNPQGAMNPAQTMKTTLLEPMLIHKIGGTTAQRMKKISELMELLGLSQGLLGRYPHQISGGEAQRLVICRALTLEPKLLVLDEPTSMLDVSIQAQIMVLLQELKQQLGLTYLYISHNLDLQRWFSQRLMIMHEGVILEQGTTEQVLSNPVNSYSKSLINAFEQWDDITPLTH